jgi:hypothetical protein
MRRFAACCRFTRFPFRGAFWAWCRPALSRLRHIIAVFLETTLAGSGVEDARKRPRSACRSTWSLWSRCRCLAIVWTLFAWSGRWFDWPLFCSPARARINYDLRGLAAWVVLGSPACNPSIGRTDPPLGRGLEMRCHHRSTSSYDPAFADKLTKVVRAMTSPVASR